MSQFETDIDSKIYKWNGDNFAEFQSIPTKAAYDWEFFTIGADHYLAVANAQSLFNPNIDSKIYRWNGANFVEFQAIPTNGAWRWEFFMIDSDSYLAAANGFDGSSNNIDSKIYKTQISQSITIVKEVNESVTPPNKPSSQAKGEHSIVGLDGAAIVKEGDERLILWNKLGSQAEVENSEVGLDGTFNGGSFVGGVFGDAFRVNYDQNALVTFPKEVIPIEAGTIEFWAKLTDVPQTLASGENPALVKIWDGTSQFTIQLNGNDGAGNGGLAGRAGKGFSTGTGVFGSWTYEQVLGAGQVESWHHYALVWNKDGIPGVDNGTRKVAVFLDGQLNSGRWNTKSGAGFAPLTGGKLALMENQHLSQGNIAFDNLKIWDFAKTDFSDRLSEESGQIFDFSGDLGDFSLFGGGSQTFSGLAVDSYTVTEIIPKKWTLLSIVCDNGLSIQTPGSPEEVTIDLQPGQDVVCTFINERLAAVDLTSLTAAADHDRVTLAWETTHEIDVEGFNIWRSETETGEYVKINETLIPTRGNIDTGAGYEYVDTDVVEGQTYYYKLEDIDTNDVSTFHGPASATPGQTHRLYLPIIDKVTRRSKLDFYPGQR